MRKNIRDLKSITKTRRKVTINDLLVKDDINGILSDLDKSKPDIKDLIVIQLPRDGGYRMWITEDTLESTAVWLLECVKNDIINDKYED
jgi:hypothetical protein